MNVVNVSAVEIAASATVVAFGSRPKCVSEERSEQRAPAPSRAALS
jgi:hypothetical protein